MNEFTYERLAAEAEDREQTLRSLEFIKSEIDSIGASLHSLGEYRQEILRNISANVGTDYQGVSASLNGWLSMLSDTNRQMQQKSELRRELRERRNSLDGQYRLTANEVRRLISLIGQALDKDPLDNQLRSILSELDQIEES